MTTLKVPRPVYASLLSLTLALPGGAISRGSSAPGSPDELNEAAVIVEAHLLHDLQPAGYWETEYTSSPVFVNPATEMNTFVPSIVVALLDRVTLAGPRRLALDRAKAELADQIESDGTVRYYGRPASVHGATITADADDTALVWTVAAPASRGRLACALNVLKAHRTAEGLYRTWLASETDLFAVNLGRDPNPPDIGIQLDVLGLLVQADPPAARELASALAGHGGDARLWVYYQVTPLLPILRSDELRQVGYPVAIPAARHLAVVAGQEDWVRACELIGALGERPSVPALRADAAALLARLAGSIERHPPLFYHNDLSASVARYYWSADFGMRSG